MGSKESPLRLSLYVLSPVVRSQEGPVSGGTELTVVAVSWAEQAEADLGAVVELLTRTLYPPLGLVKVEKGSRMGSLSIMTGD